jgi:23S rRNA U2552 (ribose-2'-O)-methylase RlmE/FtsJ
MNVILGRGREIPAQSTTDLNLQCEIYSTPGIHKLTIGDYFAVDKDVLDEFNKYDKLNNRFVKHFTYDLIFVNKKEPDPAEIDMYYRSLNNNGVIYYFYNGVAIKNTSDVYYFKDHILMKIVKGIPGKDLGIISPPLHDPVDNTGKSKYEIYRDLIAKYYLAKLNFPPDAFPPDFIEKRISVTLSSLDKLQIDITPYKIDSPKYYELVEEDNKIFKEMNKYYKIDPKPFTDRTNMNNRATNHCLVIAKSVSHYLNTYTKTRNSNAFIKLWEIYAHFNIIKADTPINAFHMCEAPGQWILTTTEFIKTNVNGLEYEWTANSLNFNHPTNKKIFTDNIIADTYRLIELNPTKWLYGEPTDNYHEGTGDVTVSNNIRWYRENVTNVNLVTGDAGLPDTASLLLMQKLDYGQMAIVLATLAKGGNCVVKCFLPYMNKQPNSNNALECYVNILHTYSVYFENVHLYKPDASRPQSGEFYIVGVGFKGIDDLDLNKILTVLDNFTENTIFINKDSISNTNNIMKFMCELLKYNNKMKTYKLRIYESLVEYGMKSPYDNYALALYKKYAGFTWLKQNKYPII